VNSFCLPLKEINLYYSLYLGNDGIKLLVNNLWFFEYFAIERLEFQVVNFNDTNALDLCNAASNWL